MEVKPGYKQTDVGVIPEEWKVEPLGELSDFVTSGSRGWAQFYSESGALFIRSQNVRDGRLSFEDVQYVTPPTGAEGNRTKVRLNDLLITITGNSVGNVALVEQTFDEAYISQHVGLVRLKEPTRGAYICRYLSPNSPGNPQIAGSQSGQSKPGLNLQNLKDFRIALPPTPSELHAIATALSDVDGLLGGLDRLIAKKRDLKQAAMQQLLTGQTRLPGFSGAWEVTQVGGVVREGKQTQRQAGTGEETGSYRFFTNNTQNYATFLSQYDFDSEAVIANTGGNAFFQYYRGKFAASMHCLILLPRINAKYLYYALKLREPLINESCFQGSGLKVLHKKSLRDLAINFPKSSEEQAAIAAVLTDTDVELVALEARREKTAQLKLGILQELLTGRIRLVEAEALHA